MNLTKRLFTAALFTLPFLASYTVSVNAAPANKMNKSEATTEKQIEEFVSNTVVLKTNLGEIVIQLDAEKAPLSVKNFKSYVKSGFYDGTIFHRTIPNFMVQGGGFDAALEKKETLPAIKNEADNGLKNVVGSLSMARTSDPHSATSQFFINVSDNGFLDHKAKNPSGWGYAVFAQVTQGMSIVEAMSKASTKRVGPHANVPVQEVVIEKASFR